MPVPVLGMVQVSPHQEASKDSLRPPTLTRYRLSMVSLRA